MQYAAYMSSRYVLQISGMCPGLVQLAVTCEIECFFLGGESTSPYSTYDDYST